MEKASGLCRPIHLPPQAAAAALLMVLLCSSRSESSRELVKNTYSSLPHQLNPSIWNGTRDICIVKVPKIHRKEKAASISLQGRVAREGRGSSEQFDDDNFITGPLFSNGSWKHNLNKFILLLPDEHIQSYYLCRFLHLSC